MKVLSIALGLAVVAAAFVTPAQAQNYPWCAYYSSSFGGTNCGFTTYQQCMADVSGIGGFCQQNNTYVAPALGTRRARRVQAQ
jgi:Protein of unknown function (DUF3551)